MNSIAIIGASNDRSKYGNKAVRLYNQLDFKVYPIHPSADKIEGIQSFPSISSLPELPDMVSIYLPPQITLKVLPEIAAKGCKEVWLNPGSESPEVLQLAEKLGLNAIQACTLMAAESLAKDRH